MTKEMRPGHLEDAVPTLEDAAQSLKETVSVMQENAQAQTRLATAWVVMRDTAREAAHVMKEAEKHLSKVWAPATMPVAVFTPEQEQRMERSIQVVESQKPLTKN